MNERINIDINHRMKKKRNETKQIKNAHPEIKKEETLEWC